MTILNAIIDAIVISIILYGGIFLMIKINPRIQLHNYPPGIKKIVPQKTPKEKRLFLLLAFPILVLIIMYIFISFYQKTDRMDTYIKVLLYWIFVYFLIACLDLFICDYLIFCIITPKFIIIPGTEGNDEYKNKSYHTKTIPKMVIVIIIGSLLTSLIYFMKKIFI
jgi:purine-cytosine permease-like protein